jgi:hypothetical protein
LNVSRRAPDYFLWKYRIVLYINFNISLYFFILYH